MYSRDVATRDPRPDLVEDTALWHHLLVQAYDAFAQPHPLHGALDCARCLGATLAPAEVGYQIIPGADDPAAYPNLRAAFVQHSTKLQAMLRKLR